MNLLILSPVWLAWVFVALMTAAALQDAVQLRISNLICLGVVVGALTAMWLAGPDIGLWQNFAVLAGLLVIGTPIFAAGKMGGGDVKLLAAAGLWFDLQGALVMLIWVLIAGGILALIIVLVRLFGWSDGARRRVHVLKRGGGIPYGVAIAAGTILAGSAMRGVPAI
jgi:prepilin peptidase CpaA